MQQLLQEAQDTIQASEQLLLATVHAAAPEPATAAAHQQQQLQEVEAEVEVAAETPFAEAAAAAAAAVEEAVPQFKAEACSQADAAAAPAAQDAGAAPEPAAADADVPFLETEAAATGASVPEAAEDQQQQQPDAAASVEAVRLRVDAALDAARAKVMSVPFMAVGDSGNGGSSSIAELAAAYSPAQEPAAFEVQAEAVGPVVHAVALDDDAVAAFAAASAMEAATSGAKGSSIDMLLSSLDEATLDEAPQEEQPQAAPAGLLTHTHGHASAEAGGVADPWPVAPVAGVGAHPHPHLPLGPSPADSSTTAKLVFPFQLLPSLPALPKLPALPALPAPAEPLLLSALVSPLTNQAEEVLGR